MSSCTVSRIIGVLGRTLAAGYETAFCDFTSTQSYGHEFVARYFNQSLRGIACRSEQFIMPLYESDNRPL